MREIIEPIVSQNSGLGSDTGTRLNHPAFGQISVSRVQGHAHLYGSDFTHRNTVRVTICESELSRHLNNDWPFARREIIEVEMSEAQWATFVSSFNHGSGVQCTILHRDGKTVPGFPLRDESSEFGKEMSEQSKDALDALKRAAAAVANAKMSKKDSEAILEGISKAAQEIGVNTDFVAECFDRHMEDRIQKAKVEVNAYLTGAVQRAGLEALIKQSNPMIEFDGEKEI